MRKQEPRIVADDAQCPSGASRPALVHEQITRAALGAFYTVYNELGFGFLESVYRDAMALEIRERGLIVEVEAPIVVRYRNREVGHFRADLLVEKRVVLELKACPSVGASERQQLLNYLRGTGLEVGLLLHFGQRPGFARMVMSQELGGRRSNLRRSAAVHLGDDPRHRFSRGAPSDR